MKLSYEFWKPNTSKSLFYTLEVKICVRDTETSSKYIFQRLIRTSNTSVNSNNREIITYLLHGAESFLRS